MELRRLNGLGLPLTFPLAAARGLFSMTVCVGFVESATQGVRPGPAVMPFKSLINIHAIVSEVLC
ncbi:hypothetical protein ILFOPFJJ_01830 [Ensifer psoraleae]|nr:hypothetical protein [Sinorhizobium psoraleae]